MDTVKVDGAKGARAGVQVAADVAPAAQEETNGQVGKCCGDFEKLSGFDNVQSVFLAALRAIGVEREAAFVDDNVATGHGVERESHLECSSLLEPPVMPTAIVAVGGALVCLHGETSGLVGDMRGALQRSKVSTTVSHGTMQHS